MGLPVNIIDPTSEIVEVGEPIEVGPGRGDMRMSSMPASQWFAGNLGSALELIGGKTVSYSLIFATQWAVAAAVMRLLTMSIRVPLKAYQQVDDDDRRRLRKRDHQLARAIVEPWEGADQAQLIHALLGPLLVHGNGLTDAEEGARGAIRFDNLDWRTASPIKSSARRIAGWTINEDGETHERGADHVIHVAWWSPFGPIGVSPLRQLGTTVKIEDAAQRYQMALLRNGARPPSAISASEKFLGLKPEERTAALANLRQDVTDVYAGVENGGKPVLLPPGLDWKATAHTAVEAELIDQRKVAREEIAAVYQIPPPMIGILDKATFSNITVQREMAYTDSLAPPLVLIEKAINAQLVRGLLREDDVYVEFDFAGVLRGDRLKEIQALREAIDAGLMTRNEGRGVLNFPASGQAGMDDFFYAANNQRRVGDTDSDDQRENEDNDS